MKSITTFELSNKKRNDMETRHTGEWLVKPNPSDSKKYGIWSQHPTRGTSLIAMAQMDFMTEEELKSNAKLIAAAPELLDALIDCQEFLSKRFGHADVGQEMLDRINKVNRAIKKATK